MGLLLLASGYASTLRAQTAETWPEYRCHALHEGHGRALPRRLRERLLKVREATPQEAISTLEELARQVKRESYGEALVYVDLAWRYHEIGRPAAARTAVRKVLDNDYVPGALLDAMRALAAQTYADEQHWPAVVEVLQPVIDGECRPTPASYHQLLAFAYVKMERYADASSQLDATCLQDAPDQLQWTRLSLDVACTVGDARSCAERVLRYAQHPQPSDGLREMLNDKLAMLAQTVDAQPLLRDAEARGVIDAELKVIPQPAAAVIELEAIRYVAPGYPRSALRDGQSGYVVMNLLVGTDGKVLEATAVDASPPGVFEHAAISASKRATFRPKIENGKPVETSGQYTVRFRIAQLGDEAQPAREPPPPSPARCIQDRASCAPNCG